MKHITRWAWTVVLGTALCLSWWSLFVLAHRYGMPSVVAGMVSLAIDGVALVLADLAMQRATMADSAALVKLFTMCTVALSAWLNFEHAVLWGFPLPIRVLFAAPSVLSGIVFELKLRNLHHTKLHDLDQVAPSLPRFGFIVWALHPFAALGKVSRIAGSRLRSVPITIMDWNGTPATLIAVPTSTSPAQLERGADDEPPESTADVKEEDAEPEPEPPRRTGRKPVPDEFYATLLREYLATTGGKTPSGRQVAQVLSVGQERARRLLAMVGAERGLAG